MAKRVHVSGTVVEATRPDFVPRFTKSVLDGFALRKYCCGRCPERINGNGVNSNAILLCDVTSPKRNRVYTPRWIRLYVHISMFV